MINLKNVLLTISLSIFGLNHLNSQCTLNTFSTKEDITCGDCVTLSVFGSGTGNVAFEENFNSGSPIGWQFTQNVTIANNTCGVPSPDASNFMWMGDASTNPRDMTTVPFDLTLGGVICFEMRYAIQGQASPCEGPDLPSEGVYLQYSTNGTNWITIEYWDPNGGIASSPLSQWDQYCVALPPGALTNSTQIRWHQDDVSGAEYDHWGIDNVKITLNDPNYEITWVHDNYAYGAGSSGGENPTPVCPQTTTTYTANITDGTNTCTSSITINVVPPTIIVNAGLDSSICANQCIDLQAETYKLISPAKTPTYANSEISAIVGNPQLPSIPCLTFSGCNCWDNTSVSMGQSCPPQPGEVKANMEINIQDLNTTALTSNSITKVCINNFNLFGFGCTGYTLASMEIVLKSPNGTEVVLAPTGSLSGSTISNMCFEIGAPSFASSTSPYTGTFNPVNSWTALNGENPNGVWNMILRGGNTEMCVPGGSISGWSISFDDPELREDVDYVWTPTTNMTNETTLTPNVCPQTTTTYTLTSSDIHNCATNSDQVTISIVACCDLEIDDVQLIAPTCGSSNGKITILYSGEIAGLAFSIDNGVTFQSSNEFNNLSSGTYQIRIIDDAGCPVDRTVTLVDANAPVIDAINTTDAACDSDDGTITVSASGGNGDLSYSSDNGVTFQNSAVFSGLSVGSYTIIVKDEDGCEVSQAAEIISPNAPIIDNVNTTNPDCGMDNGEINIVVSGGTTPYSYSINNGANYQPNNNFTNLTAGAYTLIVKDANGCEVTQQVSLNSSTQPNIQAGSNQTICLGEAITLTASGGITYTWSNGVVNGQSFVPSVTTTYTVTGTDANGCSATATVTITVNPVPDANFTADITAGEPVLNVTFTNTSTNATAYIWDFGNGSAPNATSSSANQNESFTAPGVYTVELTATNGNCEDSFSMPITVFGLPEIGIHIPNVFTPDDDKINDEFFIDVTNGKTIQVIIFNRWGNIMYEMSDFNDKWSGSGASDGVYFFTYEITDLQDKMHTGHGHVTLKR